MKAGPFNFDLSRVLKYQEFELLDVEKIWITELYKKNSKIIEKFGEKDENAFKKS